MPPGSTMPSEKTVITTQHKTKRFPLPVPMGWFAVSYSDEILSGQSRAIQYFGHELVLFRTESGQAVVLDAYCPHLGAHLGHGIDGEPNKGGNIKGEVIACPFHGWQFDKDGQCANVPYAKNMPPKVKDKRCLKSWPLAEANQVIWVWYHPEDIEPLWPIEEFEQLQSPDWGELIRHDWVVKSCAQDMAENGSDPAHFVYVHGTASFPDSNITYSEHEFSSILKSKMQTPHGDIDGKISNRGVGPGQSSTLFQGICDTHLMGMTTPVDDETVHMRFAFNQKRVNGETPRGGVGAAVIKEVCKQFEEDKPIWENKIYRANPILCDGDGPIAKFRKWYKQFYAGSV